MKIFVINLEHEKKRMAILAKRLANLNIEYERFVGVCGKDLSNRERDASVNHFRWWCAVGRQPTFGEIGCGLSHIGIYKRMIHDNIPYACILEDDVILDDRFPEILEYGENYMAEDIPQVMLLSNHSKDIGKYGDRHTGFFSNTSEEEIKILEASGDFCSEGYFINKLAANNLLQANFPMITPCDWWGRWRRQGIIKLYHVFPSVARQNKESFMSNTNPGIIQPIQNMGLIANLIHKFKRLIGIILDRIIGTVMLLIK